MRDRVGNRERAAPGAAEDEPALDAEMTAQPLDVVDQKRRRIRFQLAERTRTPGPALIEHDDTVVRRIEEATMRGRAAGTRAAMKKYDGDARAIAAVFPVHSVQAIEVEHACAVRFDLRLELAPHADWL